MEKHRAEAAAKRVIGRLLFKALCALYPDRYMALIEPPDVGDQVPLQPIECPYWSPSGH
jgi:hypothetical protein